jgi:hypothetical protein
MNHLIHRPAKRMERRLPSGITTGSIAGGSIFTSNTLRHGGAHSATFIVLLGATVCSWRVIMRYFLPRHFIPSKRSYLARQAGFQRLTINLFSVHLTRRVNQFLTLIHMGADPIIISAKRWHGCHHSNQGGKIQCQ